MLTCKSVYWCVCACVGGGGNDTTLSLERGGVENYQLRERGGAGGR